MNAKQEQPMELATSRYQEFKPEHGLPIGITVGRPRFVRYPYVSISSLAPHELFRAPYKGIDNIEIERRVYFERLVHFRDRILGDLQEVAEGHPGKRGVLLCFENVNHGEACHRRWAAEWFAEHYGWDVPEIQTGPSQLTAW
ncbi:hypothetical protein ACFRFL_14140 [Streptomyces sp. NPDC056708]|uniref:hypothetical protein n=1 Tax=unclassified Streptomyces TaxID=2593676 RepID=UPI00368EA8E7